MMLADSTASLIGEGHAPCGQCGGQHENQAQIAVFTRIGVPRMASLRGPLAVRSLALIPGRVWGGGGECGLRGISYVGPVVGVC